jgi:zinc protease
MGSAVKPPPGIPRSYHFPRFERATLGNGLGVLVAPITKLPVVTVILVADAGAMAEPEGRDGAASLTARALLEGTARSAANELQERLERLGAAVSADADWDTATVSLTVLRPQLERALAMFAEIALEPAFPEREIARLKAERLAEILQLRAEPRGLADEMLARVVYSGASRYSRPEGGGPETVGSLLPVDLRAFHAARFRPGGCTLIIAGDVTTADGVVLAERWLGNWAAGAPSDARVSDAPARRARALHLVDKADAPQSELRLGHVGLPRRHPDYFPVLLMNAVLGGLFSSRINLNLRERHAYTYGAFSGFDWRRGAGPFLVSTAVQSEVTGAAAREILQEIDAMLAQPIARDELELATSYLAGVFPIKYETTDAVARALAALVVFGLPVDYFDRYRDHVRAVTAEDVLAAAQQHLHPDALQLVVVGSALAVRTDLEALGFGPLMMYERDGTPAAR